MNLETAAALARNVAAIVLAVSVILTAVTLLSGVVGVSLALANAFAVVALSALVAFALSGALFWTAGASLGGTGLVLAALVLTGAFLGGHWFGVRGLWIAALSACGAALAWLLLWAFGRELPPPLGLAGPMAAFACLTFLSFGALGALTRAAAAPAAGSAEQPAALALLASPPAWFDCAYAALGGSAEAPGQCVLTPPPTASAALRSGIGAAPVGGADAGVDASETAPDEVAALSAAAGLAGDAAPAPVTQPEAPNVAIPEFDRSVGGSVAVASVPGNVSPPEDDVAAQATGPDAQALEPDRPVFPEDLVSAPAPEAPVERPDTPDAVAFTNAASIAPGTIEESAGFTPPAPSDERQRTALVCFPMLDAVSDRLCPDSTLGPRDLEVLWREPGGQSYGESGNVECYIDHNLIPHATIVLNLSGALAELMPRGPSGGGEVMRGDAIYGAVTRVVGGVRSAESAEEGTRLLLSTYLLNGSKLVSPWASQDFGAGRGDRLFDLRVGSQTLALLKRLKDEIQTLRRGAPHGDLAAGLAQAAAERPVGGSAAMQPLMLLITDPDAAVLDADQQAEIIAAFRDIGAPFFAIEIGAATVSAGLQAVAEATGGAVFVAADAASLDAAVVQSLLRARSFCTVRVSAPESFFDRGALEIRLRRRLKDSCVYEQIATLDCASLSISERYETPTR